MSAALFRNFPERRHDRRQGHSGRPQHKHGASMGRLHSCRTDDGGTDLGLEAPVWWADQNLEVRRRRAEAQPAADPRAGVPEVHRQRRAIALGSDCFTWGTL